MTIRVCHVMSADLWAGAEIQLATLASYLVTRSDIEMTAALFNDGLLAQELRRLGVRTAIIDEQKNRAARIVGALAAFLKANRFDLLHTHRYKDTILGAIAGKIAGVPHVVRTVHGLSEAMTGSAHLKFQFYDLLDKAVLAHSADRVVAVSHHMEKTLAENGYKRSTLVSVHNGVNLEQLRPFRSRADVRTDLGIPSRALIIGTVGRLVPVKGHALLLRAAKLIQQRTPGVRFVIVGDGPLEHELRAFAARLGLGDACLFAGARTDVPDLLGAMDIFALPSLSEGIPMAVLEAMALSRPVVATSVGGVPEVVIHGETGLLVRSGDEFALADACVELVKDPDRSARLGARGRAVVEARFSHDRNGAAIAAMYHTVCRPGRIPQAARFNPRTPAQSHGLVRFTWNLVRAFADVANRRLTGTVDTWKAARQMRNVRRNPTALMRTLRSAAKILVVCHGNIIRSPFAARLVADAVADRSGIAILSGGLAAIAGKPSHPTAILAARKRRIDLTGHHASPLDEHVVNTSDVIFVMEVPHLVAMRRRFPQAGQKTFLLTCLASDTPLEIQDPFNGDASRFEACFAHITRAVRPIVRTLSDTAA